MKRVKVPAKLYNGALRFCNDILKAKGRKAIKKLPAGRGGDPKSCPCSKACGAFVESDEFRFDTSMPKRFTSPSPEVLIQFVEFFDAEANQEVAMPVRGLRS